MLNTLWNKKQHGTPRNTWTHTTRVHMYVGAGADVCEGSFFPSAIQTTVLNLSFLSENRHFNRHWNMSHISRLHKINSLLPGARPYSHAYTQLWGGGDDQQPPLSSSVMERYFSWTRLSPTAAEMRLIWSTWLISMVFPLFMHNITIFTGIVIGKQCVFCYVHVWSFLSKTNWDQQDAFNVCLCPLFRRHVLFL